MGERELSHGSSGILPEAGEGVNSGAMESLELCLILLEGCKETVEKMPSRNFNEEQCGYLVDKLGGVAQAARLFLKGPRVKYHRPGISWDGTKWVRIFKFLLALAVQIEDLVRGCSRKAWVEAAMTLTNVAEYVASLGFNLEMCNTLLSEGECGLTLIGVQNLSEGEVEIVKQRASVDMDNLLRKVTLELDSSELAKHLLRKLVRAQSNPTSDEVGVLGQLFDWVVPGRHPQQLGKGASACVYKVMWLGTPVAKKTFLGPENPNFLHEVEILSQLSHPNITPMFCATMNKKSCSIIMELMDGDLFSLMQKRSEERSDSPPFPILEAIDIMHQIAEGVNYLHTKGIVYRDLKSMNILAKTVKAVGLEMGYVLAKVVDFGISKTKQRSATFSNMTYNQGSFRWMAPELVKPSVAFTENARSFPNFKFKCDVYSFGMVAYEILTGELPFKDEWMPRKVKKMVTDGARPELPMDCPALLKALIEDCWIGDAKERPDFATICSTLKYLKYLLMRGDMTHDQVEESRFDHTPEIDENTMCLTTLKVNIPLASPAVRWGRFFTKPQYKAWFPKRRRGFYTYKAFQSAASSTFPMFGTSGSYDDQRREIAAFLAHVHHNSRGLRVTEGKWEGDPDFRYRGRGPMLLTWAHNYGPCGEFLGVDLRARPEWVAEDAETGFKTALWLWMHFDCHGAMLESPPNFFGTVDILKAKGVGRLGGPRAEEKKLVDRYTSFCDNLGVDRGFRTVKPPEPDSSHDGSM